MSNAISINDFLSLIQQYCLSDIEFRHEIERKKRFGTFQDNLHIAYRSHIHNGLTLREAFGMTERLA